MSHPPSARIHPTAIISAETEIGEQVEIGPYAVIEGQVKIGAACVIRPGAFLIGPLTLGRGNVVHSGAVLGDRPQHLKYNNEPTGVEIGDYNIFREHVTVHRGTTHSMVTRIGSHNFFMVHSHVAHDCEVGNHCFFTNGSMIGGHCVIEDQAYLSGNAAVHQFVRIGRLAMLSGCSAATTDVPPFIIHQDFNNVVGINVVGMRRAGLTHEQINAVKQVFRLLYREGLATRAAIAKMQQELGEVDVVQEFIAFLGKSTRGISHMRQRGPDSAAA